MPNIFLRYSLLMKHFYKWGIQKYKDISAIQGRWAIWYHLYNLKNVKKTHGGVLILVKLQAQLATLVILTLLHGCFSRFFNSTNGTKSPNASHIGALSIEGRVKSSARYGFIRALTLTFFHFFQFVFSIYSGDNASTLHYGHAGAPNDKTIHDGDMV